MPDHAAFLRGMNIGGRRITNVDLKVHFEATGLRDVGTFRASGNVVFTADRELYDRAPPAWRAILAARIETALETGLGYPVPTFVRTAAEVRRTAAEQPFSDVELASSRGKLQVGLLLEAPEAEARTAVLALAPESDRLAFGERELYWLPGGGFLESALDLNAVARLLGPTTFRTKGTIEQIASKYFAN